MRRSKVKNYQIGYKSVTLESPTECHRGEEWAPWVWRDEQDRISGRIKTKRLQEALKWFRKAIH